MNALAGLVRMHGVDGALAKADEFIATNERLLEIAVNNGDATDKRQAKANVEFWKTIRSHLLDMI